MTFKGHFPATKVVRAPFGLLSVATVMEHSEDDVNWAGFDFDYVRNNADYSAGVWATCGASTPAHTIYDSTTMDRYVTNTAFGITVDRACSTIGSTLEERNQEASDALDVVTGKALEHVLWNGCAAPVSGPFYLTNGDAVDAGPAGSVIEGLALLEDALADCSMGEQGIIHMSKGTGAALGSNILQERDGHLQTFSGTHIAAGVGYSGLDENDSKTWLYATGPITVHLSPVTTVVDKTANGFDSSDNTLLVRAERFAAFTFASECLFSVQVDLATL